MMIKVMFVCHGNICRSPMAEFVFKDIVKKRGLESSFFIASSATSTDAIGSKVHYGTRDKLNEFNISTDGKISVQIKKSDYDKYDYIIGMDNKNITNLNKLFDNDKENKVFMLLDFTKRKGDIADPWYTGDFDITYNDVYEGCQALLEHIISNENK